MGKQLAAVIGVGQTHHRAKREDVSMTGLLREAVDRALADAGVTCDIDAVVVGKAPDLFEGVMMPELFLAEALGAVGKPLLRVHTAGSVGGSTAIVAASLVQSGIHERVLTAAFEKQSESNAMWAPSVPVPFIMPVHAGAGGYFAPHGAHTSGVQGLPLRLVPSWLPKTVRMRSTIRMPTCTMRAPRSRPCSPHRCCGIQSGTTRPVRHQMEPALW
ncbi:MAG: hypothetical protein R2709_02705 [Marmoricola sp.]